MITNFSQGKYEIYWYKGQTGDTPTSPVSPTNNIASSPMNNTTLLKKGALVGIGLTVAKRTIDTVRNEITATSGNEILQTNINNSMKVLGYVGAVAVGGIVGGTLVVIDVAFNAVTYGRELTRQNRELVYNQKLNGRRVNIAGGSAYYG